jgi:Na+-transporting methylmalonyl-CoA/oxaloacetate decarboxylase gamma subunit
MSNLEDDDGLKQFFSKVAKQHNINYDERDWQKMEKMLDAENARVASLRSTRWKAAAIGFGLLSLSLLIYFFVTMPQASPSSEKIEVEKPAQAVAPNVKEKNDDTVKPDATTSTATTDLPLPKNQKDESISDNALSDVSRKQKEKSSDTRDKTPAQNESRVSHDLSSSFKTESEPGNPLNDDGKKQTEKLSDTGDKDSTLNESRATQNSPSFKPENPASTISPKTYTNEATDSSETTDSNKTTAPVSSIDTDRNNTQNNKSTDSTSALKKNEDGLITTMNPRVNDLSPKNEKPALSDNPPQVIADPVKDSVKTMDETVEVVSSEEEKEQVEEKKKDRTPGYSRWSVSLAVAPDFSSTEGFSQSSAGSAVGLTFQYEFYKRWSIQTGALITSKKYWNTGDQYSGIGRGYWVAKTNGVLPERIDGGCEVLEIPLALRYTIVDAGRNRLQASAGVSSYIMVSETYHFTFEDPNPYATVDYRSSNTRNYFFGVGSVSIAYERMIHPRFAIGLEPYMKIPLAKIGWAKLPLYTAGAYVTLRYRIAN